MCYNESYETEILNMSKRICYQKSEPVTLVLPSGKIDLNKIDQLALLISNLMNRELDVILVSSGAMGFELDILKMDKRPAEVARQQAVSSVGQVAP